jgi:alanyl-tRNA synthetase
MTSAEIRKSFLEFFEQRGHRVVPSAPVIPHGDPTLLFTNAGMNQFKDVFLGAGTRDYVRAVNTQKCIRVSGKHNDLEEVGRDTYHHTFFEMLGNWSFGDYYKKEAIGWAWELLTNVWGLEKDRLYATVFESDDEADTLWKKVASIDPRHVLRFGKKDNFWEMGETGPCGPCSEIHIDLTPDRSGGTLVNAGDPRVMEIWNLVFIQHNRNEKGELENLPAKHVDTGMGFERVCAVLQGKSSNYDTDVFSTIIASIGQRTGTRYDTGAHQVAMRVIADHLRMLTFSITDGALPGNEGRGYVLRRILRRAARFGRNLGMREPFIYSLAGAVVRSFGGVFPEIVAKQAHVEKVIKAEEENFNATLDRGLEIFEAVIDSIGHSRVFPGEDAFKLYDTFGFPVDLTQLMAEERGVKVDLTGFTELMEEQRERSRKAIGTGGIGGTEESSLPAISIPPGVASTFVGYSALEAETRILATQSTSVVLEASPFYAQAGGQVGDTGILKVQGKVLRVVDTRKTNGPSIVILEEPVEDIIGLRATAIVDTPRRLNVQRNHSATHLVHEALRRVLGTHVHQQGSLVAPDRLRFDFPHFGKITPEEIRAIEDMVNDKIAEDINVFTEVDLPLEKARKIPDVKMFFGDKYGDTVRVVFIDEGFSVEFCGGTHVASTKDIGFFKIVGETSIASGVRRIEAVTGEGILRYLDEQINKVRHLDSQLARLVAEKGIVEQELSRYTARTVPPPRPAPGAVQLPSDPSDAIKVLEANLAEYEALVDSVTRESNDLRKELSKAKIRSSSTGVEELIRTATLVDGIKIVSSVVVASTMEELKGIGDTLRAKLGSGVGIIAAVLDEKVALVCVVTDDLITKKNLQAGKIVGEMAKQLGGGGGGKPHLATAGGKDIAKLGDVLHRAPDIVRAMLPR